MILLLAIFVFLEMSHSLTIIHIMLVLVPMILFLPKLWLIFYFSTFVLLPPRPHKTLPRRPYPSLLHQIPLLSSCLCPPIIKIYTRKD